MKPTDEELVAGVVRGEQEAFAVLFDRYRAIVCSHVQRILRDEVVADDLAQEVFLRLWHRADQWQGAATL